MMKEADVQKQIFELLVRNGHLAIRVNSGAIAQKATKNTARRFIRFVTWQMIGYIKRSAGVSDILACVDGRFVAIEVKAPGKLDDVTDHQQDFLDAVSKAGGVAFVADNLDIVMEALQ